MKQYKSSLAALLLTATLAAPSTAQQVSFVPDAGASDPCAEYFGCLHYGTLTEAQARTARGHPLFVEPQSVTAAQGRKSSATPDRAVQAIVAPSRQ